ncbi:MAG: hypothetical protein ETSY1_36345 [Candidatus Entotheonella factor]|uniref:DEAD/DEAH-box helicase domain-containing protein n=1 Tax=Entotheonella factor TaxID=1429438 RepID=W4L7S0_ENTF1|nr:MAG: hypothetical protein ETSY1_36345 [Candidatus Entotheonella factor]
MIPEGVESVTDYLDVLKRYVLGQYIIHHETIPERAAQFANDLSHLPAAVPQILQATGIDKLYTHQAEGIEHVLAGRNVVIATPTASGKTMVYNIPVLTTLLHNRDATPSIFFPSKRWSRINLMNSTPS